MTSPNTPKEAESQTNELVFGLEDRPKPWKKERDSTGLGP